MSEMITDENNNPNDPWLRCVCGNTPQDDGYWACSERGGLKVERGGGPIDSWNGKHFVCAECGRYFAQDEKVVLGRLKTAEEAFAVLSDEYGEWNMAEKLSLGSADEHLHDEALTPAQRRWLSEFVDRWDMVDNFGFVHMKESLAARLRVSAADVDKWRVRLGQEITTLEEFVSANGNDPAFVRELIKSGGQPYRVGIGGGWSDEITLLKPE